MTQQFYSYLLTKEKGKCYVHKNTSTRRLIAAVFTIAPYQKQPKRSLTDGINKLW